MLLFDPIQDSRPARPQQRQVVSGECQADWEHPEAEDRQKAKKSTEREQRADGCPQEANGCANAIR
jgi:hypothetical protein